jgi:hypothetical protein
MTPTDTSFARRLRSESLTDSWLAARLGIDKPRIDALRRAGELIGVREAGSQEWRYPAWQFEHGRARAAVPRIVRAAREAGLDETRLYEVMTMRLGLGGEQRLADLLLAGHDEQVVAAVRSSSARP